jgi:hypothetical protein
MAVTYKFIVLTALAIVFDVVHILEYLQVHTYEVGPGVA